MKKPTIHIIGGTGQMGTWLREFLKSQGFIVSIGSRKKPNHKALLHVDMIIFSVPINHVREVIRETVPKIKPDALLLDLSSVMQPGQNEMRISGHPSASLHFLFGPSITDIMNQHVVFSPVHKREAFIGILRLFTKKNAHISEMSAQKHDNLVAHIQALTHFSNLALSQTLHQNKIGMLPEMTTPTFLNQTAVITRVLSHNAANLLVNIQTANPAFIPILKQHLATQEHWLSLIEQQEVKKLESAYEELQHANLPRPAQNQKNEEQEEVQEIVLPKHASLAYLGPEGTFSHQAAKNINYSGELLPQVTFYDIFKPVAEGKADFGIIPAENSIEGTIRETLDYLVEWDVETKCSYTLPVSHCLLSDEKERRNINRILSHPQALAQCRRWIQTHLPNAELIPTKSTISDVEKERYTPHTAFIGSKIAAQVYKLHTLSTNIEDTKINVTKFYVIAKEKTLMNVSTKRTLLFLSVFNRVGVLKDILSIFAAFTINLNKIESRPSNEKIWDYYFFVEVEIARSDPRMPQILSMLKLFCPEIKILGQL